MKRFFSIIVLMLFCLSSVNAMSWTEARTYITKITLQEGFGKNKITYNYYSYYQKDNESLITYARINCFNNNEKCHITYYKPVFSLSKHDLDCVTYHELGHQDEWKIRLEGDLSEEYANNYMQLKDSSCKLRYSEVGS